MKLVEKVTKRLIAKNRHFDVKHARKYCWLDAIIEETAKTIFDEIEERHIAFRNRANKLVFVNFKNEALKSKEEASKVNLAETAVEFPEVTQHNSPSDGETSKNKKEV